MARASQWTGVLLRTTVVLGAACGPQADNVGSLHLAAPIPPPRIKSLSPDHVSPRDAVPLVIDGTGFTGTCEVRSGVVSVRVTPVGGTQITVSAADFSLLKGTCPGRTSLIVSCGGSDASADLICVEDRIALMPPLTARGAPGQRDVAIADLDGDKNNDFVIASLGSDMLSLYRGDADGRFAAVRGTAIDSTLTIPDGVYAVAVGDLDADKRLDIVVTQRDSGSITILWNETLTPGKWSFRKDPYNIFSLGKTDPKALVLADLEQDGYLDIVVANQASDALSVLAVKPRRSVFPAISLAPPFGPPWKPEALLARDVDKNGYPEIFALGDGGTRLTIVPDMLHLGPAGWPSQVFPSEYGSLALGDLNADGYHEVVLGAAKESHVLVVPLDANGGFSSAPPRQFTTGAAVQSLDISDVDSDSLPDLVVGLVESAPHSLDLLPGNRATLLSPFQPVDLGSRGGVLHLDNMNGDSAPDAVLAGASLPFVLGIRDVAMVRMGVNKTFEPLWTLDTGGPEPFLLTSLQADNDANQYKDLVVADTADKTVRTLLGTVRGTFEPLGKTTLPVYPGCLSSGDYNGDSHDDLFVCRSEPLDKGVDLWLANTDGTHKRRERSIDTTAKPVDIARDEQGKGLDGIAPQDFVVGTSSMTDSLVLLRSKMPGAAAFTSSSQKVGSGISSLFMTDVDGTNNDVLAAASADNAIYLLKGKGTGAVNAAVKVATVTAPDTVIAADVNKDSWRDLVVLSSSQDKIWVFLNDKKGAFPTLTTDSSLGAFSTPTALAVGDYNGDSVPDLAVRLDGIQRVRFLLGLGDGTFFPAPVELKLTSAGVLHSIDLNADTKPDLVLTGSRDVAGKMTGWLMTLLSGTP